VIADDAGTRPSLRCPPAADVHTAGMRAVGAADLDRIPAAMARLDELALTAMVRVFAECVPQLADPQPRSPASVVAALGAAPRHGWLVRRWLAALTGRGLLHRDGDGRVHGLDVARVAADGPESPDLDRSFDELGFGSAMADFARQAMLRLPALVRDEQQVRDLLSGTGQARMVERAHHESLANRYLDAAAAHVVVASGARSLIELGAGSGECVQRVLDAVGEAPLDYLYTDPLPASVAAAAQRFGDRAGVRYALADINGELTGVSAQVDVVLAMNVLHNAVDLERTLAGVRELLVPGGLALLAEGVKETCPLLTSMLFLMSPEAGRPAAGEFDVRAGTDRVLLDAQEWRTELAAAGLDPVLELPEATSPVAAVGQTLFVARAV
jgi:SAM-dependent methyltransferase